MQNSPRKSYLVKFPVCKICGADIAWPCRICGEDYCRDCTIYIGAECLHRPQYNVEVEDLVDGVDA